ncbi:MAG: hypothetical protein HYZ20_09305 [Burkholderiales bacterium]|nr:hypothetical protein [Burkholderiales bacterium]
MDALVAGERPSPLGCVLRRSAAKAIDVGLFAALSYSAATLALAQPLAFDALVPAFLSALWVAGFIVSADLACVLLFGRTPGEFLAGIRVLTLESRRLPMSLRQDRTVDALVEGTLGCVPLLARFWRLQPAPYDAGCIVQFARFTPQRVVLTLALLVAAGVVLVGAGLVLGLRGVEAHAPPALSRALRAAGLDVSESWVNPVTGARVTLPRGWQMAQSRHSPGGGEFMVEFGCDRDDLPCVVRLVAEPGFAYNELDPAKDTAARTLDARFKALFGRRAATLVDRPDLAGQSRLAALYAAPFAFDEDPAAPERAGTGILWFTERRHRWGVDFVHLAGPDPTGDEAARLAFALIASSLPRR